MREYKFRAFDSRHKKMLSFGDIELPYSESVNLDGQLEGLVDRGLILMQYTGLNDKNGEEIYKGDILRQVSSDGEIILHIIKYDDDDAKFIAKNLKLGDDYTCGINKNWLLKKEVIGNIYENPELLN